MFKTTIILSLLIIIVSCLEKDKNFVPAKFEIQADSTSVKFNYWMYDMVRYKAGYICLVETDSESMIALDKNFIIQKQFTNQLNKDLIKRFYSVWTSGDTLFGIRGYKEYELCFWKDDQWIPYKNGVMTKENYCHHELYIPIYEDDEFVVHSCCKGEFGGAVYFHDKRSGKVYSCESTCLVGISKVDGAFIITSTLPHFTGHSTINKIADPRKLYEIKSENELVDCDWYNIYPETKDNFEITNPKGYNNGVEALLDTFDILILGSFKYEDHPYYIYSDMKKSYLGYLSSGKLITIDTIYPKPMWYGDVRDLMHSRNMFPFRNRYAKGVVFVEGNKIRIMEFKSDQN